MNKKTSKHKLLDATIEAIYNNGLHSVTTAKIAKQANLSEAMIYKHFGNKDEMIMESFIGIKQKLNNFVYSRITLDMDFETTSYNIWLAHVDYFLKNPKKLRVLNQIEHSNYMTENIRENCLKMSNTVIDFFQKGINNHIFKDMHMEIAIALFFSPLLSITESIIENRIDKTDKVLNLVYSSTMSGIKIH